MRQRSPGDRRQTRPAIRSSTAAAAPNREVPGHRVAGRPTLAAAGSRSAAVSVRPMSAVAAPAGSSTLAVHLGPRRGLRPTALRKRAQRDAAVAAEGVLGGQAAAARAGDRPFCLDLARLLE